MRTRNLAFPVLAFAGVLFAAPVAAQSAHDAHDAHGAHATRQAPAQVPGQRWATDAPLRAGMRRLRDATIALEHYQMGHMDDAQRDNAVATIDAAIKDMIASCRLKPDADAALHGLLVQFIAGANGARTGHFTHAQLVAMQDALAKYPALFDDAGWSQPAY